MVCLYGMTNIEPSPGDCRSSIDESLHGEVAPFFYTVFAVEISGAPRFRLPPRAAGFEVHGIGRLSVKRRVRRFGLFVRCALVLQKLFFGPAICYDTDKSNPSGECTQAVRMGE